MKHSTPDKAKFKKLQRRLGLSLKETVGLLELLWRATVVNAIEGDIGRLDNETIAIECDYEGDPDKLVAELVNCGWLDECDTHRLVVHDWSEHAPKFVHGNLKSHGKQFAVAKLQPAIATCLSNPLKQPATDELQPAIATCSNPPASKPSQVKSSVAKPSQVKPSQAKPSDNKPMSDVPSNRSADVVEVWEFYLRTGEETGNPHRGSQLTPDRRKLISRYLKTYSVEQLCKAIYGCHNSPHNLGDNDRSTKYLDLKHCIGTPDRIERNWQFQNGRPRIKSQRELVNQSAAEAFLNDDSI